jgi:hypothetical protein
MQGRETAESIMRGRPQRVDGIVIAILLAGLQQSKIQLIRVILHIDGSEGPHKKVMEGNWMPEQYESTMKMTMMVMMRKPRSHYPPPPRNATS